MQKQSVENDIQRKAFELWWNHGNKGVSYQRIADELGYTKLTIYNWCNRFGWKQRAIDRAEKINARIERAAIDDATHERITYIKMIRKATKILDDKIDAGEIKIDIQDLDKLVRLSQFLHGEPDSRSEDITLDAVDKEIRRLEAQIAQADGGTPQADEAAPVGDPLPPTPAEIIEGFGHGD